MNYIPDLKYVRNHNQLEVWNDEKCRSLLLIRGTAHHRRRSFDRCPQRLSLLIVVARLGLIVFGEHRLGLWIIVDFSSSSSSEFNHRAFASGFFDHRQRNLFILAGVASWRGDRRKVSSGCGTGDWSCIIGLGDQNALSPLLLAVGHGP